MRQAGATLHRSAWPFHCRGLSCCGAQAPDTQAQWLWLRGLVAPRHVGSSQTRARNRVPCIGRQILNHFATREALSSLNTPVSFPLRTSGINVSPRAQLSPRGHAPPFQLSPPLALQIPGWASSATLSKSSPTPIFHLSILSFLSDHSVSSMRAVLASLFPIHTPQLGTVPGTQ